MVKRIIIGDAFTDKRDLWDIVDRMGSVIIGVLLV